MKKLLRGFLIVAFLVNHLSFKAWASHGGQLSSFGALAGEVDPYTGAATLNIPLHAPSGRAGIEPNLQLQYNSSLPNGMMGVGWMLELGSIQRSTRKGVPSFTSADQFVLRQSGSMQELENIGTNLYAPKTEGAFLKIEFVSNLYWKITDKKGTIYFFGQDASSQEYNPANTSQISKWCLNRVEDVFGNYMTISYFNDTGKIYPQYIRYTGNTPNSLATHAQVEFVYDVREDKSFTYIDGFKILTQKILKQVLMTVGGSLQNKYVLGYTDSVSTKKSLLTSVTQYGADGTTALPPMTLSYQNQKGFELATGWTIPAGVMFSKLEWNRNVDLGVRVADVNADGYQDFVRSWVNCGGTEEYYTTYLNNKTNGWAATTDWYPAAGSWAGIRTCESYDKDYSMRFGDFNSDGWVDKTFYLVESGIPAYNRAIINQRTNRWDYFDNQKFPDGYPIIDGTSGVEIYTGVDFSDVNADGWVDFIKSKDGLYAGRVAYLNATTDINGVLQWSRATQWDIPAGNYKDLADGAALVDLNGDNLADIYYMKDGTTNVTQNIGNGWVDDGLNSPWLYNFGNGDLRNGSTQMADINADFLADMVIANASGLKVLINSGYGWFIDTAWTLPEANFTNLSTRLLDANADGMLDIMIYYNNQPPKLYLNIGKLPDLLSSVNNGVGGVTNITYTTSTKMNNTFLPFPVRIVESITTQNGLGDAYTTQYSYAQGLWLADDKDFHGFGYVKVIDPLGNYSESKFLQDEILNGRPYEQSSFDSTGKLYAKVVNTWDKKVITPEVNFVYLKRSDKFIYDGDATGRRTAEEFFYDETTQKGNLTKAVQLGEVNLSTGADIGTDSRSQEIQYVHNTSSGKYLVGFPSLTQVKDHTGQVVRKTWMSYDGLANAVAPTKGNLTKKEDWAGDQVGAVNPIVQYTYDNFGNLLTTTDPLNHTTTIGYEAGYKIFPLTTQNALGHQVTNQYYGVNGVALSSADGSAGLWGQLKSTTDPNNQAGLRIYDTLGRLVKSVSPLDTIALPTSISEYQFNSNTTKIMEKKRIQSGQAATIDATSFFDGLGRLLYSKTPSKTAGQYTLSGQTQYNSRGLPEKKYLAKFSTVPLDTIETINTADPKAQITYDAMGRVVQSTNPDGTYSNVQYSDWVTTTIDENGHKQESEFDAYGRLIKKREYSGADGRSPNYPAVAFTLFATTEYTYDSEGNLIQTKDAKNNITTIAYDKLGRKTSMNDPDMKVWQYVYDAAGNLTRQTDAKNQNIHFTYDALNRLTNKTDQANLNVNYTYDDAIVTNSKGRLTKAAYGANAETNFRYDTLGRETQSMKTIDSLVYNVDRSYDDLNRLTSLNYPTDGSVTYAYNAAGQINSVQGNFTLAAPGPSAPILNTATAGNQSVSLAWSAVTGATGYKVKYGTASGSHTTVIDVGNVTTHTKTSLTNGTAYYFVVTAYNTGGESVKSNERSAIPQPPAPTAPNLTTGAAGHKSVYLAWNAVSGATGYKVKYGTTAGNHPTVIDVGNVTGRTVTGLTNGTMYYFVVTAYNAGGESPKSNERGVRPFKQIVFDSASKNQWDNVSQVTLSHTISSAEPERVLVVAVGMKDTTAPTSTSVKFGTLNMSMIQRVNGPAGTNKYALEYWYLLNPPSGANNIQITFNTTVDAVSVGGMSMLNIKQQAPEANAFASSAGSQYPTVTISALTTNAWVVDAVMANTGSTSVTATAGGQTLRYSQQNTNDLIIGGSNKGPLSAPGATTFQWALTGTPSWQIIAASFAPAP